MAKTMRVRAATIQYVLESVYNLKAIKIYE